MLSCAKMSILAARSFRAIEKLDELNHVASRKLIERMAQDPRPTCAGYLNLIFVGRCLERVGDHATNIAEDAVYAAAAETSGIRLSLPRREGPLADAAGLA